MLCSSTRSRGIGWGICLVLLLVGSAVLYQFDPAQSRFFPRCILYSATGFYCPGCGASRGLHELLHGHYLAAAHLNLLIFVIIPLISVCWLAVRGFRWERVGSDFSMLLGKPWIIWCAVAFVVAFGIMRNLPFQLFSLLAPPV